jgi:hypothetical protein
VLALVICAAGAIAQETPAPNLPAMVPRFPLPTSGLEWRQPAMPLQYWDATGRRAAAFGKQDGKFEAWIWPIKVLHGFRVEFRQDGMPEPVRGEAWLREVITRPESTTLVYVHPKFTVREIVWAAPDSPALIIFFDVDSDKPLNITAKFVPDFKPMWPASMGGQHSWWIAEDKAFGLGDAQEKHVALIGSPAVASYTDFMDHSLVGGEMLLGVRVIPHPSKTGLGGPPDRGDKGGATESDYAAIVMSLGMDGEKEARANYEHAVLNLRDWYEAKAGEWRGFLARTTQIETPDPVLNRAWQWGKVAIHSGWVCTPVPGSDLDEGSVGKLRDRAGCGMIAGYGPAGDGERPGFAWWFGGDGLMATWAMEDYGDLPGALQELRFLKARQREDGKITHEIVQSLGLVDWFKDFHFAYMHADTTPMYLYSVAEYYRRTGDKNFLQEFWPSVMKAFDWCVSVTGPDGLMDNTKAGLGAIEVGVLKGKVTKDVYLEGFWMAGLLAVSELEGAVGHRPFPSEIAEIHDRAQNALRDGWRNRGELSYPFGVGPDNQPVHISTPWASVLHAIGSVSGFDEMRAETARLSEPGMSTDWGVRTVNSNDPVYDPVSYNNGTVWPFLNTFVDWIAFEPGDPFSGYVFLRNTAQLTGIQSPGYMPEHMNGTYFESGERSVPHQLFSTVGVLVPTVRGLFGLITRGGGRTNDGKPAVSVGFAPAMPAGWSRMSFAHYPIAGGELSGEVRQSAGRLSVVLNSTSDRALFVQFYPAPPIGARVRRVLVNGKRPNEGLKFEKGIADSFGRQNVAQPLPSHVQEGLATLPPHTEIEVEYDDGIGIVPPVASPIAGGRSSALKIIRAAESGKNAVDIQVAGLGGSLYSLNLVSSVPKLTAEGATVSKTEDGYRLEIPFEGSGYVTREIRVRW